MTGLDPSTRYYFRVSSRGDGTPYSRTHFGNPSTVVDETTLASTGGGTNPTPTPAPTPTFNVSLELRDGPGSPYSALDVDDLPQTRL